MLYSLGMTLSATSTVPSSDRPWTPTQIEVGLQAARAALAEVGRDPELVDAYDAERFRADPVRFLVVGDEPGLLRDCQRAVTIAALAAGVFDPCICLEHAGRPFDCALAPPRDVVVGIPCQNADPCVS